MIAAACNQLAPRKPINEAVARDMIHHVRDCAEVLERLLQTAPPVTPEVSYLISGADMVRKRLDEIANDAQDTLQEAP